VPGECGKIRKSPIGTAHLAVMKLYINGEERDFGDQSTRITLAALVETLGMKADRVAVELNREIVPRDRWAETRLAEGDKLEVVHFVGGGAYRGIASAMP